MIFLQQRHKQRPEQYGSFSNVQSSLFYNLERLGFDPFILKYAAPCWEGAGLVAHNYAKTLASGDLDNGAAFRNGGVECITALDNIDTNLTIGDLCRDDTDTYSRGSTILAYQNTVTFTTNDYAYLVSNNISYGHYGLWMRDNNDSMACYPGESYFPDGSATPLKDGEIHTVGFAWAYNDYPSLIIDHTFYQGGGLMGAVSLYKTDNVLYGGRADSGTRYCAGIMSGILATNTRWSDDELGILSENINNIWQRHPIPIYSYPSAIAIQGIISETLSISDSSSNIAIFSSNITEAINLQDSESNTATFVPEISEILNLTDVVNNILNLTASISESINFTDSTLGDIIGAIQGIISESLSFTDLNQVRLDAVADISESLGISDLNQARLDAIASISESLNISDEINLGIVLQAILSETFNISDEDTSNLIILASLAESLSISDEASVNATFSVQVDEALQLTDAVSKIALFQAVISETFNITDIIQEVSLLPNGKVSVTFSLKIPDVGFSLKKANITFNLK